MHTLGQFVVGLSAVLGNFFFLANKITYGEFLKPYAKLHPRLSKSEFLKVNFGIQF